MGACGMLIAWLFAAIAVVLYLIWDSSAISTHRAPGSLYGTAAGPAGSAPPPAADAGNTRFDAGRIAESVGRRSRVLLPSLPEAEFFKYDTDAPAVNTGNEAVNARSRSEADGSAAAFLAEGETTLAEVAQRVEDFADAAAFPAPPQFEPLSLDVLPQRYWEPVFPGCAPVFTDKRCDFFHPTPRLWVTDMDQLRYERSLEVGRVNLIEPLNARQAIAQLLSIGVRSRRDVYTQATAANDISSQSSCAQLKTRSPAYVRL